MSKRHKNKKALNKTEKSFFNLTRIGLLLFFVFLGFLFLNSTNKINIISDDIPFTHNGLRDIDAGNYFRYTLRPILIDGLHDKLPKVRQLMVYLDREVQNGKINIGAAAAYRSSSLAGTQMFQDGQIYLTFCAPRLMDYQNKISVEAFRDLIITVVCHELLHYQYDPVFNDRSIDMSKLSKDDKDQLHTIGEAKIWAMTVEYITLPLAKNHRWVGKQELEAANLLNKLKGNYMDPIFLDWIWKNCVVHD